MNAARGTVQPRVDTEIEALVRINLEDLARSFGVADLRLLVQALAVVFRRPAEQFARQMLEMDRAIAAHGRQAFRTLARSYANRVTLEGFGAVPASGPLLLVSNHPGMADTPLLIGTIPRDDLRIVADDRPFLRSLPGVYARLIPIPEERSGASGVMRALVGHLRAGGAVLSFPAGRIEPDPLSMPGALASLDGWSRSIGLAARLVPGLRIQPVCVAGVISRQSLHHPLTLLRRSQKEREQLAASLQLLYRLTAPHRWPVAVRVRFAPPIPAAAVAGESVEQASEAIIDAVRDFYRGCILDWGGPPA